MKIERAFFVNPLECAHYSFGKREEAENKHSHSLTAVWITLYAIMFMGSSMSAYWKHAEESDSTAHRTPLTQRVVM